MAKGRSVEDILAELSALRGTAGAGVLAEVLPKYLGNKSNLVVARAAEMAGKGEITRLQEPLVAAFWRFMEQPVKTDPGCFAKKAIVQALYEIGAAATEVFLAGIRHVQHEPRWGGEGDSAAEVRGLSAMGLVRIGYPDVMNELVELMMDGSHQARILAARAVAYTGWDKGALLLRLKVLAGDREPEVTAECLLALAGMERTRALGFVARFVDWPVEAVASAAALGLGEMRHASALKVLLERWERETDAESRRELLVPIAISRLPEAVAFLTGVVETGDPRLAAAAVEAMRIYRHDEGVRGRVGAVVERRGLAALSRAFTEHFG
jgi:HEAT repeat protein